MTGLSPTQARKLYIELGGENPPSRQLLHKLARDGVIRSYRVQVTTEQTMIPIEEVHRLVRDGIPKRKAGRPKKRL